MELESFKSPTTVNDRTKNCVTADSANALFTGLETVLERVGT
jgi:hypothetical protein